MIYPELRDIRSPDLLPPALPPDPATCVVRFEVLVGQARDDESEPEGGESFAFLAVTPAALAAGGRPLWGRAYLILPSFSWEVLGQSLAELLARAARPTWAEVVTALSTELHWVPGSREAEA